MSFVLEGRSPLSLTQANRLTGTTDGRNIVCCIHEPSCESRPLLYAISVSALIARLTDDFRIRQFFIRSSPQTSPNPESILQSPY